MSETDAQRVTFGEPEIFRPPVRLTVSIPVDMLMFIDGYAKRHGLSYSTVVRIALARMQGRENT